MADAFAGQAGHGGQKCHHIGRRQPAGAVACADLVVAGGDTQGADAGSALAGQIPELPSQFRRAGLAVGAGDRHRDRREWRKESRCQLRKYRTRIGIGNVQRPGDTGFRPRHHGDGTSGHGSGGEILAIHPGASKCAEDIARRNLAVIQRKASDSRVAAAGHQIAKPDAARRHSYSFTSDGAGNSPVRSRSRPLSGATPSGGAMRSMMRRTAGAATIPAVRKPAVALLPRGSSIIVTTT